MIQYKKIGYRTRGKIPGEWVECEARMPGCKNTAVEFHHIRGRGKLLNEPTNLIAVCRECHMSIHASNTEEKRRELEEIVAKIIT